MHCFQVLLFQREREGSEHLRFVACGESPQFAIMSTKWSKPGMPGQVAANCGAPPRDAKKKPQCAAGKLLEPEQKRQRQCRTKKREQPAGPGHCPEAGGGTQETEIGALVHYEGPLQDSKFDHEFDMLEVEVFDLWTATATADGDGPSASATPDTPGCDEALLIPECTHCLAYFECNCK
jgi:hypothetical protein